MSSAVRTETVPEALAGQRVDNFLLRHLKGVPRTRVYRLLRRGEVRVNGGRVKPTRRLAAGDRVRIPPVRSTDQRPTAPSASVAKHLEAAILHEDERLLIIDKPSGLAVHGGSGIAYGIVEALRTLRPQCRFLDLAHRLDRDTSGCLVLAKRRSTLRVIHEAFRDGGVEKRYTALLHGDPGSQRRRVTHPLGSTTGKGGERMIRVDPAGQRAETVFKRVAAYPDCALVQADLYTGRTHQIRVHAASIGHPVAMDDRYGNPTADRRLRSLGLRRLFLHATGLAFDTPEGRVSVSAPLPDSLTAVLERLQPGSVSPNSQ
jgi:23S rRNA pseudouridine955/2504/2580 synthase